MKLRVPLLSLPALALVLSGCASSPAPSIAASCEEAMVALAEVPADDFDAEDKAVTAAATECATVEQFIAAAKAHPDSWFYDTAAAVEANADNIILTVCAVNDGANMSTPTCLDAKAQGILD